MQHYKYILLSKEQGQSFHIVMFKSCKTSAGKTTCSGANNRSYCHHMYTELYFTMDNIIRLLNNEAH